MASLQKLADQEREGTVEFVDELSLDGRGDLVIDHDVGVAVFSAPSAARNDEFAALVLVRTDVKHGRANFDRIAVKQSLVENLLTSLVTLAGVQHFPDTFRGRVGLERKALWIEGLTSLFQVTGTHQALPVRLATAEQSLHLRENVVVRISQRNRQPNQTCFLRATHPLSPLCHLAQQLTDPFRSCLEKQLILFI